MPEPWGAGQNRGAILGGGRSLRRCSGLRGGPLPKGTGVCRRQGGHLFGDIVDPFFHQKETVCSCCWSCGPCGQRAALSTSPQAASQLLWRRSSVAIQ